MLDIIIQQDMSHSQLDLMECKESPRTRIATKPKRQELLI
jgi:hypothetical protein